MVFLSCLPVTSYRSLTCLPYIHSPQVSEIEVQASRASSLMADLNRIVPDVELAMGPLLKVGGGGGISSHSTFQCLSGLRVFR